MLNNTMTTADTLFTEKIKQLQQRALFKYSCQFILYAVGFFLLLHGLALAAEKSGWHRFERGFPLYVLLSLIALFAGAIVLYISKSPLPHLLIRMDDRFGMQDRLSTAYEYQLTEKESIFSASLLEDAARSLKRFSMKELLPLNFSRLYLAIVLVGTLNLLLLFVEEPARDIVMGPDLQATDQDRKDDTTQRPEERRQQDRKLQEKQEDDAGYKRMRERIEELQQQALSPQERAAKLQEMLQEVQSMQERLTAPTSAGDESINIENLPIRQLPQRQQMMMSKLASLEDILEAMLSENASGASGSSQELPAQLQDQLSELLEKLEGLQFDSSQKAREAGAGDDARDSGLSSSAGSGREDSRNGEAEEGVGEGSDESSSSGQGGGRMADTGQEGEMSDLWRQQDDGSRAAAGSGSSDEEYPPSAPETSGNPILQDKVLRSEQEQYNIHIRSVTEIGKASLPEEDLTRPYRREVESVLQQEEMPLNYREYIKNYFLSIGLTDESP